MDGVVCGVHQRERERGSERRLGVTRYSVFCTHLQFLPGKQETAPNF